MRVNVAIEVSDDERRRLRAAIDRGGMATRQEVQRHVNRQRPERISHFVQFDEPSATSKRSQKAVCRSWVRPTEVADQRDDVTCPQCLTWLDEYERLDIA